MSSSRQVLLGAFFVIVLSILGYYTLFLTDFSLFKETYQDVVHFPDAHGLRTGDPVLVAGMRRGRVRELTYDPAAPLERRITATLVMDEELLLRTGFDVRIEDATLLGGRQVYIDPGPAEAAPVAADVPRLGRVAGNPLSEVGELVSENRASFGRIVANLEEAVAGLNAGRGLLGRLAVDDSIALDFADGLASLRVTADNAAVISGDLREGRGALGRLLADADLEQKLGEIADDLATIGRNLSSTTADIEAGRGIVGMALKDDALAEETRSAVSAIREIVERLRDGEGTVGKLLTREEVYERIRQIADDLARASRAVAEGEGSLGKLVMDTDLYEEVERAMSIITRTLEEYREAAPITTFTSVLFGGL
jgi:phospholipid/cholesterol/gamma-HCH transport system substrate-binding protein